MSAYVEKKRAAMAAHASQIPADSFFLASPPEFFAAELRCRVVHPTGRPPGLRETWLFGH